MEVPGDDCSRQEFRDGEWIIKRYSMLCDICGKEAFFHVCPEEGYPFEAELCCDCEKAYFNKELINNDEVVYFRK